MEQGLQANIHDSHNAKKRKARPSALSACAAACLRSVSAVPPLLLLRRCRVLFPCPSSLSLRFTATTAPRLCTCAPARPQGEGKQGGRGKRARVVPQFLVGFGPQPTGGETVSCCSPPLPLLAAPAATRDEADDDARAMPSHPPQKLSALDVAPTSNIFEGLVGALRHRPLAPPTVCLLSLPPTPSLPAPLPTPTRPRAGFLLLEGGPGLVPAGPGAQSAARRRERGAGRDGHGAAAATRTDMGTDRQTKRRSCE